jgi:hypothetical protein
MVSIDLVRKSSGGIEELVKVDRDRAAERNARSDAVKFDLKTDRNGVGTCACLSAAVVGLLLKTLKSSPSFSRDTLDSGSSGNSPGGVVTGSRERRGERDFPPLGVIGNGADGGMLGDKESPKDGRLSKDPVRVE